MTEDVKKIVGFIQENCEKVGGKCARFFQQSRLTLNMLVDIFLGKCQQSVLLNSIKLHNRP